MKYWVDETTMHRNMKCYVCCILYLYTSWINLTCISFYCSCNLTDIFIVWHFLCNCNAAATITSRQCKCFSPQRSHCAALIREVSAAVVWPLSTGRKLAIGHQLSTVYQLPPFVHIYPSLILLYQSIKLIVFITLPINYFTLHFYSYCLWQKSLFHIHTLITQKKRMMKKETWEFYTMYLKYCNDLHYHTIVTQFNSHQNDEIYRPQNSKKELWKSTGATICL